MPAPRSCAGMSTSRRAAAPRLRSGGLTSDRPGRPGIAIHFEGAGVLDTLVLDPATGAVLASETTVLSDPGALPGLRYTTYPDARTLDWS